MRRKEKEIFEESAIETVIRKSIVCRLGMVDGDKPYIVPLCFGYKDRAIYVHGSLKGKRINAIKKNNSVCFEFDINSEIIEAEKACDWGMKFQSVIGFGKAILIDDPDEKRRALDIIMRQYSDSFFQYPAGLIEKTSLIKIEIESMSGKQSGFNK